MPLIQSNTETWLKSKVAQSSELTDGSQRIRVVSGKTLSVKDIFMDVAQHIRVTFEPSFQVALKGQSYNWTEGYLYAPHINGISAYLATIAAKQGPATGKGDRYFLHANAASLQQCNNKDWGDDDLRYGAVQCGLTSTAQLITAVWPWQKIRELAKATASGQFEDWVGGQFMRLGASSTSMEGHVAVLKALGIPATAYRNRSVSQLKEDLRYAPVILGMAYKSSGHFVTAVGYCDNPKDTIKQTSPVGTIDNLVPSNRALTSSGIIYNDPCGDRDWSGSANNWHRITKESTDPAGLHNFCTDADMGVFWAEPDNDHSGWCVVIDRSVKLQGGKAATPTFSSLPKPETAPMPTIEIIQKTWLKRSPVQSLALPSDQKREIGPGTLTATVIGAKNGHARLKMIDGEWYIFNAHFKGQEQASGMTAYGARSAYIVDPAKLRSAIMAVRNPSVPAVEVEDFCKALEELAPKYTIENRVHLIHFLAQVLHESGGLMYLEELADGEDYTDRDDLGNCTGEARAIADAAGQSTGAFYKGHGLIQLTGYTNHKAYADASGFDAVRNPTELAKYPHALGSALWFWSSRGPSLSEDANDGLNENTVIKITKVVNGGTNGLDDRLHYFHELCDRI